MSYIYIASPYTHKSELVRQERYEAAMKYLAWLITKRKEIAYSPIVHCHELGIKYNLPKEADFWERFDANFIVPAKAVHILCIDGWEKSKGIEIETKLAQLVHKPLFYIFAKGLNSYKIRRNT